MSGRKTSNAEYKTIRFNPDTSEQDKQALEIIAYWKAQGFDFKDLVVDRLLRGNGFDPVKMKATNTVLVEQLTRSMEGILERFGHELMESLRQGKFEISDDDSIDQKDNEKPSEFLTNFVGGFVNRQQRKLGNNDE